VSPGAAPPAKQARPLHLVVMGVSGCGKTSIGLRVAQALGLDFVEGDALHPPRNVALMAAGTPLTDTDRADWLAAIAARLGQAHASGSGLVVSCSALKRSYRDRLRVPCPGLRFVHLHGEPALLRSRLQARTGHYMPPSLLDSQLITLEPPGADEDALSFDITPPTAQVAAAVLAQLQAPPP
jgi:gluconokinase